MRRGQRFRPRAPRRCCRRQTPSPGHHSWSALPWTLEVNAGLARAIPTAPRQPCAIIPYLCQYVPHLHALYPASSTALHPRCAIPIHTPSAYVSQTCVPYTLPALYLVL